MTVSGESGDRDVVPRWRSVHRTIAAGEFQVLGQARELSDRHKADVRRAVDTWEREGDVVSALELVEAGVVAGAPEISAEAASFLADVELRGSQPRLVARARGQASAETAAMPPTLPARAYERIAETKRLLRANPRSPILWGDLARRYTSLGQHVRAERAITVARALAPNSRYLLRAHVRFLVHLGQEDRAVRILESSSRARTDPWLLASLLSVSERAKLPLPSRKVIRRVLENDSFRIVERSELNSEAATLEWRAGSTKPARSLLREALLEPTDNSLAQAEWISNRDPSFDVRVDQFSIPFADEAFARAASEAGDWQAALSRAQAWMDDQPFDPAAAVLGSYVASIGLEDFKAAADLARAGLLASPGDAILRNNLAYALIQLGEFAQAAAELQQLSIDSDSDSRIAVTATTGLLAFRTGHAERGYELYRAAIERARRAGERETLAMALSMLVQELVRVHETSDASSVLQELDKVASQVRSSGVRRSIERARQNLGHEPDA